MKKRRYAVLAGLFLPLFVIGGFSVDLSRAHAADAPAPAATDAQVSRIDAQVQQKKSAVKGLNDKIQYYQNLLLDNKTQSATLQNQIALLENQVAKTQVGIDIDNKEIEAAQMEIKDVDAQIRSNEDRMTKERELLGALARRLYEKQYGRSMLEILLSNASFADFFNDLHAVASLQHEVDVTLNNVLSLHNDLDKQKELRQQKQADLASQKRQLEVDKSSLQDQQALKETILTQTQDSELQYRYVLAELKRQQTEADSEIKYLEKTLRQDPNVTSQLGNGTTVLSWPVVPSRGISTLFHDPTYPFRYIMEHPGIDIRAYQGTPVRAAAAGVVARAKDAGMGYSYVMIIHNNGISTVYGHLSKIIAKEDTYVERGELIGYSGGTPGTPGAGNLTTGPHLHFEVRLNGIPVDPLNYLPPY